MSSHPTHSQGAITDIMREAIEQKIPDSSAEVGGGGGHFTIEVVSPAFAGKSMLESHRLVYAAIAHLMTGLASTIHALALHTMTMQEWFDWGEAPQSRPCMGGDSVNN